MTVLISVGFSGFFSPPKNVLLGLIDYNFQLFHGANNGKTLNGNTQDTSIRMCTCTGTNTCTCTYLISVKASHYICSKSLILVRVTISPKSIPGTMGSRQQYTMDGSPVRHIYLSKIKPNKLFLWKVERREPTWPLRDHKAPHRQYPKLRIILYEEPSQEYCITQKYCITKLIFWSQPLTDVAACAIASMFVVFTGKWQRQTITKQKNAKKNNCLTTCQRERWECRDTRAKSFIIIQPCDRI